MQTFEDYLKDVHGEDYHGTDDDMPDAFDAWLVDLQADDWLKYGQVYAAKIALETKEEVIKAFEPMVKLLEDIKNMAN